MDWLAGRRLFLNITSNQSNVNYPAISYTCVTGPEDPYHATVHLDFDMAPVT